MTKRPWNRPLVIRISCLEFDSNFEFRTSNFAIESSPMTSEELQHQCELGQQQLMATRYLDAIDTLVAAERVAWGMRDYDTLARLYMPLQEARRQKRQRCGEGMVCLDLIAAGPDDVLNPQRILDQFPHGQLLVGGWASIAPAAELRRLVEKRRLYVETFLAAVYPLDDRNSAVAVIPFESDQLPDPTVRSIDALRELLPANSLLFSADELPRGARRGDTQTYAQVMEIWERLHRPFLAAADGEKDGVAKMRAYRRTIQVDPACELAHQRLADTARKLAAG